MLEFLMQASINSTQYSGRLLLNAFIIVHLFVSGYLFFRYYPALPTLSNIFHGWIYIAKWRTSDRSSSRIWPWPTISFWIYTELFCVHQQTLDWMQMHTAG